MNNKEIIESLKVKRDQLYSKIKSIDETIELLELETNRNGSGDNSDGYNPSWKLSEKIEFFFKKEQRFLYNRELANFAHNREPGILAEDFLNKFSAVLSRLKKDNQITNVKIGKTLRSTVWGSAKWVDESGKIKKEYLPSKEYDSESEKKKLEI